MPAALSHILPQLLPRLADAAVRGAIVLLIALALTSLLRRRSAATRHAIWVGAIAAQLLLLVLSAWGPRWRVAAPDPVSALVPVTAMEPPTVLVSPSRATPTPPAARTIDSSVSVAHVALGTSTPSISPAQSVAPTRVSGRMLLAVLWALGALAVLLRLAVGTTMVARLARAGARIDDGGWLSLAQRLSSTLGIQRPLILMRGDRVGVPITWGIVYPTVLLPDDADAWPEERRRFVLVHEMAHVKRLDALTQLIGQIVLALFWFDPFVWIATRRMQLEREHACDDYVLRHGTQPSQYANDLLEMVRTLGTPAHQGAQPAFAALAMARRSEFEGRMLSILDPVLDRHPLSRGRTIMSALASLLIVVPLAALQPYNPAPTSPSVARSSASTPAPIVADTANTRDRVSTATRASTSDQPIAQQLPSLELGRTAIRPQAGTSGASITSSATASVSLNGGKDDDSCDRARFGSSGTSTHIHANEDGRAGSEIRYLDFNTNRCVEVRISGKYKVDDDESHVISVAPGSRMYLRERTPSEDREINYTSTDGSDLAAHYSLNGVTKSVDDAANQWIASILPTVLAELSVNVQPRVARWRAQGGIDGTLRHIGALHSSGAKRAHYEALLDDKNLRSGDAERIARQAGQDIPSSGDLRSVLSKAAPQIRTQPGQTSALEAAFGAVASSGDRTAVLELYGQSNDREMLLSVMRVAETIPSSGDKAGLLSTLAPRYFAKDDAALRAAFFRVAATIPSSGDLAGVLDDVVKYAAKSSDVALGVLTASAHIASSADRSNVLIALADAGAIRTPALRDAYLRVAQDIPSSSDMRNTLEALSRH